MVGMMLLLSLSSMAQTVWKEQVDSTNQIKSQELTSTSSHGDTIIITKWDTIHHHDGLGVGVTLPFFIDMGYSHAVSERFSVGGGLLVSPNGSVGAYISSAFDLGLRSRVRFFLEPRLTYISARESQDTTLFVENLMNGTFHYNDSALHASGKVF